jgi:hypothetical protein
VNHATKRICAATTHPNLAKNHSEAIAVSLVYLRGYSVMNNFADGGFFLFEISGDNKSDEWPVSMQ